MLTVLTITEGECQPIFEQRSNYLRKDSTSAISFRLGELESKLSGIRVEIKSLFLFCEVDNACVGIWSQRKDVSTYNVKITRIESTSVLTRSIEGALNLLRGYPFSRIPANASN